MGGPLRSRLLLSRLVANLFNNRTSGLDRGSINNVISDNRDSYLIIHRLLKAEAVRSAPQDPRRSGVRDEEKRTHKHPQRERLGGWRYRSDHARLHPES